MSLWQTVVSFLWFNIIRPLVKGFLRRTTGLCELQRICYGTSGPFADRCIRIQQSLMSSRSKTIGRVTEKLIRLPDLRSITSLATLVSSIKPEAEAELVIFAVEAICVEKNVKPEVHAEFVSSLETCLFKLYFYKIMGEEAVWLTKQPFDKDKSEDVKLLLNLWNKLMDDNETDIRKPDWPAIGFQGKDPATDFRGMGMLSLHQLVYLANEHTKRCKRMLSTSNHPVKGYSFAITGIHLTHLTLSLLLDGSLRTHFYNQNKEQFCIEDLHQVYAQIFAAFDTFWVREDPQDVMQFRFVRDKFVAELRLHLSDEKATLTNWICPLEQDV